MSVLDRYRLRGRECVCGNVRMAARAVTRLYDEHLAACGLRATQLTVLWGVAALESATVQAIARAVMMDQSTLVRNLRLLERDGLISVAPGLDRRERIVRLTARGKRRFEQAMPLWEKAQKQVTRKLEAMAPDRVASRMLSMARAIG